MSKMSDVWKQNILVSFFGFLMSEGIILKDYEVSEVIKMINKFFYCGDEQ